MSLSFLRKKWDLLQSKVVDLENSPSLSTAELLSLRQLKDGASSLKFAIEKLQYATSADTEVRPRFAATRLRLISKEA